VFFFHKQCLEVVAGSSNGASVTATKWKGVKNQCWNARQKCNQTLYKKNTLYVKNAILNQYFISFTASGIYQFVIDNQPTPNTTYVLDASQTALGECCVYVRRETF